MKALASLLILSCVGVAQEPLMVKVIPFNRTDKEHCKVILEDGKPMLQTTYGGTTVAVALPEKDSHGFSVLVRVTREGKGKVEVIPERITAIYSDPDHTRFQFFDMTREWEKLQKDELVSQAHRPSPSAITPASSQADSQLPGGPPPDVRGRMPDGSTWSSSPTSTVRDGSSRWAGEGGAPGPPLRSSPRTSPFLRRTVLQQSNEVEGIVCLQKPEASKVGVSSTDTLDELDVPIGDVIFRF